jgi:hypothetical protein
MAYVNMWRQLALDLGTMPGVLARTRINEALGLIYDENQWSFQNSEDGWLTPGILFQSGGNVSQPGFLQFSTAIRLPFDYAAGGSGSPGTITVQPYSTTIVGDAAAAGLWSSLAGRPLLTEMQIRLPGYRLYNIVKYDGLSTITIDKPWMEPGGVGQSYLIYQAYFPAPVPDFKRFKTFVDTTNAFPLDFTKWTRRDLALHDPQRLVYTNSTRVVAFEQDQRPGSATLGNMLYELWPHPLGVYPYSFTYLRRGPQLVNPTDTVPYPLTEDLVLWRAKEVSYLWKESQRGEDVQRGSGADWRFLAQEAGAQYKKRLDQVRQIDRDLDDQYSSRLTRRGVRSGGYFNSDLHILTID